MNRKLLFAIIFTLLFAVGIIIWFFFFAQPNTSPTLGSTTNPLLPSSFPKRFQFIFNNNDEPVSTSTTEMTFPEKEALTQIWNKPATGQTFVTQAIVKEIDATTTQGTSTVKIKKLINATTTILMFVDRTTGYIYAYNREINKVYQISNTTIPGIYDAYIVDNGKRIVLRYEDLERKVIVGVLANIPLVSEKEQAKPLLNTTYLPAQVTSVAVNKKKTALSYFVTGDNGSSIYTLSQKGAILIANTPFKEWSLSYGGDNLYATSKPSAYLEGQTVLLPSFDFVVGGKTGLMSNPGENNIFINSMWSNKGLKTFLTSGSEQIVLDIQTLSSKCGWGEKDFLICAVPKIIPRDDEGFPDDWFQGRNSFEDILVIVNTKTGETSQFYYFKTKENTIFDVTNFSLSKDNTLITFNRKQDATLWLLDTNLLGD